MVETLPPSVAIVGVGVMGGAIATRLLDTGATVIVFDRDDSKKGALREKGARAALSAAEAARRTPLVITSLNSAKIVESAIFGPEGVASAADADTLLIDMSSIDPDSTRGLAARFHEATGGRWIDCPLSGGAPGALSGRLTVMAGGEEADFERARAVMSRLTANYTLMGPVGAGQATKLVNQVLCAIQFQAVAEAVALAERAGVNAERIPAALAGGRADSLILQEFGAKMARRDYAPTGRLDNMLKDLDGVQALARATLTALPATAIVAEIHRALVAAGLGGADNAELMRQFDGPRDNSSCP
ncbi:NAD(P)-dependent oxidoreductase [Roseiarcus sp.]|uniref:NAD(P)-dependent oxidoreductase n=1 Tax=Roseiarcus sp. TaxID=1969460 RepID=UPI003F9ADBAD